MNNSSQIETIKIRSKAVLLCPDNDSEAHMILKLAEKAGIAIIRSKQPHGANLSLETHLQEKLNQLKKSDVWIVEIPGIEKEEELKKQGFSVVIIDHHTYKDAIDRLTDQKTGEKKSSSLEQFLAIAGIDDEEMQSWGFNPKLVRGIGIMDAKYVQGLREAGYTKEEIDQVLELRKKFGEEINPNQNKLLTLAKKDWDKRTEKNGYLIISSKHTEGIHSAIASMSILNDMDTKPMIISIGSGEKINVQNIGPDIVEKLNKNIKGNTYTFGSGYCWGVNNKDQDKKVALDEILHVLEK